MPPPPTPSTPAVEATPERRGKQRLLPDLSDQIEVSGQRIVRVAREREEAPASMADIARKHLAPEEARVIEENAELFRAIQEVDAEPTETSHAEEIAARMELFTDGAAVVPHAEPDADKRPETMTVSALIGLEGEPDFLAGKKSPETIFDLFSLFPQLDGVNWYIYVERKLPKVFAGRNVAGALREISAPLTLAEWKYWYGGGTYKLIVYGPSKRPTVMNADGRAPARALTEAITVTFPGVPSSESEVYDGDDHMTQQSPTGFPSIPPGGRRAGPASMADASIEKAQLDVSAAREIRQETKADENAKKAERAIQEKAKFESDLLGKFLELQGQSQEREAELRDRQIEREREFAQERRDQDAKWEERIARIIGEKKQPDDLDRLAKLSSIVAKPDNSDALRDTHAREMERAQGLAKDAADRANHQIKEAEARADRRIEEERTRSAERIREVEKRYADLERDLRERADREVARAKEDAERRIADMHRVHTDAMGNESRNHERDMKSREAQHAMALDSLKNTYEMRLETAKSEVKRTSGEVDRWKKEAEEGRDVVGNIEKIKAQAEALGMEEANQAAEPQTVGQMLTQAGAGLFQQFPAIVASVGEMFKGRSAQELQAAREAGRAEMIEQASANGGFGAPPRQLPQSPARRRGAPQLGGGGYVPRHMSEVGGGPPPVSPGMDPFTVPPQPHFTPEPLQVAENSPPDAYLQQHAAPPMQPHPHPQAQVLQPVASVFPPPQPSSVPPPTHAVIPPPPSVGAAAPALSAEDAAVLQEDRQILQAADQLRPQYEQNVPVLMLAEHMWQQFGIEGIRSVTSIDAERVVLAIERSGSPNSPFLRRDGKQYLRALFEELRKKLEGG